MAQQEIGHAGVLPRRLGPEGLDVPDHQAPAVLFGKEALAGGVLEALPVAQMVVAHHQKAPLGQIFRKGGIALHVFTDPVGDLQNGPGLALPLPADGVDAGPPVGGGVKEFPALHHKKALLFPKTMV